MAVNKYMVNKMDIKYIQNHICIWGLATCGEIYLNWIINNVKGEVLSILFTSLLWAPSKTSDYSRLLLNIFSVMHKTLIHVITTITLQSISGEYQDSTNEKKTMLKMTINSRLHCCWMLEQELKSRSSHTVAHPFCSLP